MKAAKKQKSPRKSGKKKAQSATVPKKLVSKKAGASYAGKAVKGKTPTAKVRSDEPATIKKIHAENQRLTRQLEQKDRELRIEAALEKVRARTMAMHRSDELREIISVTFEQIKGLEVTIDSCIITLFIEGSDDLNNWVASAEQEYPQKVRVPYFKHPLFDKIVLAKNKPGSYFTLKLSKKENQSFYRHILENSEFGKIINAERRRMVMNAESNTMSFANFKHTGLRVENFHNHLYTQDENNLILRFAKVFDQAYIRFLDLQKAEAQAREAQIEAALERVRAKTMAMHKSEQLAEVATVLFEQLYLLGEIPDRISIGIINEQAQLIEWWVTNQHGGQLDHAYNSSFQEHTVSAKIFSAWKNGESTIVIDLKGKELDAWIRYVRGSLKLEVDASRFKGRRVHQGAFFPEGFLLVSTHLPVGDEATQVLERLALVFSQAYTRFLDLKNAEAQAREAQIEAAMERVRTRTMSMHDSSELAETATMLFHQFRQLRMLPSGARPFFRLIDTATDASEVWTTKEDGILRPGSHHVPMNANPSLKKVYGQWRSKVPFFVRELSGKAVTDYLEFLSTLQRMKDDPILHQLIVSPPELLVLSEASFKQGTIGIISLVPLSQEAQSTLQRFSKVFEQTYTRFLDLQKAEAQSREAQIEAALERIRSRSLAMHKSEELSDVIKVVSEQLQHLGFKFDNASFVLSSAAEDYDFWFSIPGQQQPHHIHVPYLDNPINNKAREARAKGLKFHADIIDPAASRAWHQHMFDHNPMDFLSDEAKHIVLKGGFARSVAITSNIMLVIGNYASKPYSEDENAIIRRFAIVFEQSYTRFLDLQKAEAQAREAQIEAALEKVRSRSLAMHHSTELEHVAGSLFDRLAELGLSFDGALIFIFDKEKRNISLWIATNHLSNPVKIDLPYDKTIENNTIIKDLWNAIENSEHIINRSYSGEVKNDYFRYVAKYNESKIPESIRQLQIEKKSWTAHFAAEKNSMIGFDSWSGHLTSDEDFKILTRFAKVFEQAYTRFLDLQKAEAQAREATIEAALERVRARAMGMHSSADLSSTANTVFIELKALGIQPIRCGVGFLSRDTTRAQLYSSTSTNEENILSLIGYVNLTGHPVLERIYASWISGTDYFPTLEGKAMKSYYELLLSGLAVPVPDWQADEKQHGHFFPFSVGCLYAWSASAYDEKEIKILKRFTSIIDLTFRRYLELQKSEASARDTIRQASLDRVRAEIASMRTTKDLERITPLVWKELAIQNIPFIRCGVFIMDEDKEIIHNYLTTPDGKAIAAFQLPYSTPGAIGRMLKHWQERKIFLDHWDDPAVKEFAIILVERGIFNSVEQYLDTLPKGGFHLHFLPFNQGMLYVGNTTKLKDDEVQLIQSLADAFSTAYARYEDFNRLEAAKQQVDKTLVDLKQTQQQLVQSEKMASLGELTAGIAHEIQNPLNFVNNFSEVNAELIDELKKKLKKVTSDEARAIAKDIRENEQKIVHHGKRADAIVKGMLQHSRSSSGVKEPTDINALGR